MFFDQVENLIVASEAAKIRKPLDSRTDPNIKLLAALNELVFRSVPADPTASIYRQGSTLGTHRKHWFRAKFGNGRFLLLFRFDSRSKMPDL